MGVVAINKGSSPQALSLAEVEVHGNSNAKINRNKSLTSIAPNQAEDYINITLQNKDKLNKK